MIPDFVCVTSSVSVFFSSNPLFDHRGILQQPLLLFCTEDTLLEIRRLRSAIWLPVSSSYGRKAVCHLLLMFDLQRSLLRQRILWQHGLWIRPRSRNGWNGKSAKL